MVIKILIVTFLIETLERMDLLRSSVNLFSEQLKDMRYVVPNLPVLLEGPVPASSLKLVRLNGWPEGATLSKSSHFVAIDVDSFNQDFPLDKAALLSHYRKVLETVDTPFAETVRIEALTCVKAMCKSLIRFRGHTANEAEVRFAFANPIVNMLCAVHGLFLGLKYKMTAPDNITTVDQVTEKSCSDYLCYTLHQQLEESDIKLAVVIVEVKTNANYSSNAIAQLLGYYLRSCTKEDEHTVGLLLTETMVHLVLFPFVFHKGETCANAIWLSSIQYTNDDTWSTITMLSLLAVITRRDFYAKIKLEEKFYPVSKDHHFMIRSETEVIKDDLKKKLAEVDEEKQKVDAEKIAVDAEKRAVEAEKEEMVALKKRMESKCRSFEIAIKKLSAEEITSITKEFQDLTI